MRMMTSAITNEAMTPAKAAHGALMPMPTAALIAMWMQGDEVQKRADWYGRGNDRHQPDAERVVVLQVHGSPPLLACQRAWYLRCWRAV